MAGSWRWPRGCAPKIKRNRERNRQELGQARLKSIIFLGRLLYPGAFSFYRCELGKSLRLCAFTPSRNSGIPLQGGSNIASSFRALILLALLALALSVFRAPSVLNSLFSMKRAREDDEPEPSRQKQATLGDFFRRPDGSPLSAPKPVAYHLSCPYCEFQATSNISSSSLPGALRAHVQWRHPDDFFEASTRLHATLSSARLSLFDLVGMDPIPEGEEDDEVEANAEEHEDAVSPPVPPSQSPALKRKRHSYTLKQKFNALQALDKAEAYIKSSLAADSVYFAVSALALVSRETGIPAPTLKFWSSQKEEIRKTYSEKKRARKRRHIGGGRPPLFPKAEAAVALIVRQRREQCKLVSKAFVLKHLKLEAEKEDAAKFEKAKFSPEMVNGFMRRNRFSLRYPSCIRSDDLATAILVCRAFHRQLLQVLADDGEVKHAKKPLDPSYGRFSLEHRFNGDEVPYRFGRVKSIVSVTNESLTHVAWPPGWEARLATLFLMTNAQGRVVIAAVIFKGLPLVFS